MEKIPSTEYKYKLPFYKMICQKINDLIEINSKKEYVALLNQTSTNAPVATEIKNNFSDATFTYTRFGDGDFRLTSNKEVFTSGKTVVFITGDDIAIYSARLVSSTVIEIYTDDLAGSGDGYLINTSFKIEVYK